MQHKFVTVGRYFYKTHLVTLPRCPSFGRSGGQCHPSPASLLTAISSHRLAALPGTCPDVCVQQSHAAKRQYCNLKWTLEDLLPCYCYTLKTKSKAVRSQVWQPASGLPDENYNEKPNSAKKRPEKSQTNWLKARKKPNFICGVALPLSQRNIWITRNNKKLFQNSD